MYYLNKKLRSRKQMREFIETVKKDQRFIQILKILKTELVKT